MMHPVSSWTFRMLIGIVVLSVLAACKSGVLKAPQTPAAETPVVLPSPTALPTVSPALPSPTPIPATATPVPPSPTPLPSTVAPVLPDATPGLQMVQIFLIALEDNGQSGKKIGCDDSVVPVRVALAPTQGVLRAALGELLSLKESYYGQSGLYNALYQSDLKLDSVSIEHGEAIIHLSGTLMLGGVCDNPRVGAQLEETALQFSTVSKVSIFVNGEPLEEVLSLKENNK